MKNIEQIKAELRELISKSIEILEQNCNVEDWEHDSSATMLNVSLMDALLEISELSEEDLIETI